MRFLTVAYYEFLKNIRDIKMALILLVFPLVMILMIGNSIGAMFDKKMAFEIKSGYVNTGGGITSKAFDEFLGSKEINERLKLVRFDSEAQGQAALKNNEIDTLVVVPGDIDKRLAQGEEQYIRLFGNEKLTFVESLVGSFADRVNAVDALVGVKGSPVEVRGGGALERVNYGKKSDLPDGISYYSVLTLLQVLFMGSMFGINITSRTSGSDIHVRLHSLPLSGFSITGGRVAGSAVYLILASLVTIAVSRCAYNADWSGNAAVILGTMTVFCILTVGMGMLLGLLLKSYSMALMSTVLLMLFFSSIAGSFTPSVSIAFLNAVSPMYHAKMLIFGTIYGYSGQIMLEALLWLSGQTIAVFGLVAFLTGRVRYDNF